MNKIIVISGPTATGKTKVAIELAKKYQMEVVNFDSLVFYKELSIGTAKPTKDEMEAIPHHLVGTESIFSPINAADFMDKAIPIIQEIHQRGKAVVLVGGSGFYLQAILNGMYDSPTTPNDILEKSKKLYTNQGIEPFRKILKEEDFKSYERYHENDHYRIRRAVEHFWTTNLPFSDSRKNMENKIHNSPPNIYHWNIFHAYLDIPKPEHYEIILKRTKKMYNDGLLDEIKSLLEQGATGKEKPLQSIGYKESLEYIAGEFSCLEDYLERLSINTRRLAKAQRTWFKKLDKYEYNPKKEFDRIINECGAFLLGK